MVVALAAYVGIASVPSIYVPLRRGVDESWIYAINELSGSRYTFGPDVIFTYGPLGYLLFPSPDEATLPIAAGFMVLVQLLLIGVILHRYTRTRSVLPLLAFVVLYLLAMSLGFPYEYRLLILLGIVLMPSPGEASWRPRAVLAACLAAVLLYAKFSVGLAAAAALAVAGVVWCRRRRMRAVEAFLYVGGVYVGAVLLLSLALIDGPRNLLSWLAGGLDILTGYALSMALPLTPGVLFLAAFAAVVLVGTTVWVGRVESRAALAILPVSAILPVAFRHAFTRHEGSPFFAVIVAVMGILILASATRRSLVRGVTGALVLLPLAILGSGISLGTHMANGFDLRPGWRTLVDTAQVETVRRELEASTLANLADDRLPPAILDQIHGESVDSIPVALTFLLANDLAWVPNPALQTYQAYVSSLDRRVAEHFARATAPSFLLYQFTDIDQRHPILATPAMWRSILGYYRLGDPPHVFGTFGEVALLQRRRPPVPLAMRAHGHTELRFGEWIDVPHSESLVFASLDLRHTVQGRVALLLWRIEPIFIDLRYQDGRELTFRLLPGTAGDGLLINYLPSSMYELLNLLQGIRPAPVLSFRIRGPGSGSFQEPVAVAWRSAPWIDVPRRPIEIGAIPPTVPVVGGK